MVVVDLLCPEYEANQPLQLVATSVAHNESLPCTRANHTQLSRKLLLPCINHHPNVRSLSARMNGFDYFNKISLFFQESQIELCGRGVRTSEIKILYVLLASLVTMFSSLVIFPEKSPVPSTWTYVDRFELAYWMFDAEKIVFETWLVHSNW